MSLPTDGWKNKGGTGDRVCTTCGTWKQHWINRSGKTWPTACSVEGCYESPTVGAHIYHPDVTGEKIVPMCTSCNGLGSGFNLKGGVTTVPAEQCS